MKTRINKTFIIALIILFTTAVFPTKAFAEEEEPETTEEVEDLNEADESDPPPPPDEEDPDAPIDGGVGILIASGIGYGVKKALEKRKNTARNKTTSR